MYPRGFGNVKTISHYSNKADTVRVLLVDPFVASRNASALVHTCPCYNQIVPYKKYKDPTCIPVPCVTSIG
jgi:hypothetical protein